MVACLIILLPIATLFNEIDSHNVVFLYLRFEQKGVLRIVRTRVNEEFKINLI